MRVVRFFLWVPIVVSWSVVAGCVGDECSYEDVSCDGNVKVFCVSGDHGGARTIERRACEANQRCTVGRPPHGTPESVYCLDDTGPDPRCDGQIGFCGGDQPFVCQDGHALIGGTSCAIVGGVCGFDSTVPGTWPVCLGGGPTPPDPCEDRGDAATYCPIWSPPCDGTPSRPCFNAWHVSAACCNPQAATKDPAQCIFTPFRRLDGSIEKRPGGFVNCKPAGETDLGWCCTETGSP
jgi:hypothetical protein